MKESSHFVPLALISGAIIFSSHPAADAAEITWGNSFVIGAAADISNPIGSTVVVAADFNNAAGTAVGDDNVINGIPFTETPSAGIGDLVTTMASGPAYGVDFFTGATDDQDLDALLDSHSWFAGNPGTTSFTISNLTPGLNYQVQLIAVADIRACCAARTYEPDDGMGNFNTGVTLARGLFQSVIGTFTADSNTQTIGWRSLGEAAGNNDPGLSGMVVLQTQPGDDDDGDGLFNAWEELYGLDPDSPDSDGDTIPDDEEDEDMDGLENSQEQASGTNPTVADTDMDGYLDGVETDTGTWVSASDTGTRPLNPDSDGDGLRDGVENPDLPFIDAMQTGSDPNETDTDQDLLPDPVEVAINLNPNDTDSDDNGTLDGDEDADLDGSRNAAELALGTGISDPDSDDDDLLDGVESDTGVWGGLSNTGTDPLDPDSDNDTLADGVENPDLPYDPANPTMQPGTDPNLSDSDGDLANDNTELAEGTDPTNPNDTPAIPLISVLPGLLGGDLTDPEDDGVEGATDLGPPQTAGTGFDWVSITASNEEYFSGFGAATEGAFDIFDNKVGREETKWCCGGPPNNVTNATVEFENPISITHFTISSGNDTVGRDPLDWQILGSNDGVEFEPIFTQSDDVPLWTARNQTLLIVLSRPSDAYKFIRYEVTRTGDGNHQINEIEYFGTIGLTPLEITEIIYDEATEMITVTWTSKPGRTYGIFYDSDLDGFQNDVDDAVPADEVEESTSYTFDNPLPGEPRAYFRVVQNPL